MCFGEEHSYKAEAKSVTRSTTIIDTNRDISPGTHDRPRGAGGDDNHDRSLLRRYSRDGDVDALSELLLRHANAAFRLACHFSANAHDAEDSVQITALEVMKSAENFDATRAATVRLWIMGIVVNVCRRKRVENARRTAREEKVSGLRPAVAESPVEASLDEEHLKHKIKQAVGALPGLYRTPVSLHYYDGLTSGEIASVLRIPENTIRSQLKRGIEQLREALLGAGATLSVVELAKLAASSPLENARQELLASLDQIARTGALPGRPPQRGRQARAGRGTSTASKIVVGIAIVAAALLLFLLTFKSSFIPGLSAKVSSAPAPGSTELNTLHSDNDTQKGTSAPDAAPAKPQPSPTVSETTPPDPTPLKNSPDTKIEENRKMTARLKKGVATVALAAISWTAGARASDATNGAGAAQLPVVKVVVPTLVDPGSAEVSGYVAIPDVSQILEHLDVVARAFNPQLPAGVLKMQLGAVSGDPALANLETGKPVVVMALKRAAGAADQTPSGAIFIPARSAAPYDQIFEKAQLVSVFQDGLLICASNADELKAAQAQVPAYNRIAADKGSADFRCFSGNKALLAALKPKIQAWLESFSQSIANAESAQSPLNPGNTMTSRLLKLEIKAVLELLNEIDSQQVDVVFKGDTLCIDAIANAAPDSALASLFVPPVDTVNSVHGLLVSPGLMQAIMKFAPGSNAVFIQKLIDTLARDPESAELLTPEVKAYLFKCATLSNAEYAMSTQLSADSKQKIEFALTVKDAKSVDEAYAQMAEMMKAGGLLGKVYSGVGMKMEVNLQKSARQYKGVSITSFKQSVDTTQATSPLKNLDVFGTNLEIGAVKDKVLVGASNPATLEQMIDRALAAESPSPTVVLEAMTVFGPGKQLYFDYNVIEMMKEAMKAIPGFILGPALKQLSAAKPIIGAGLCDHGRALLQVRVPLTPFIELTMLMTRGHAAAANPPQKDGPTGDTTEGKTEGKEEKF